MALFALDDQRLLVPHVVSSVERGQREVTIRVNVEDAQGKSLPAHIERDDSVEQQPVGGGGGRRVDRGSFLAACTPAAGKLFAFLLDEAVARAYDYLGHPRVRDSARSPTEPPVGGSRMDSRLMNSSSISWMAPLVRDGGERGTS